VTFVSLLAAGVAVSEERAAQAAPDAGSHVLRGYAQRSGAHRLGALAPSQQISIVVALKPRNEEALKAFIQSAHNPASQNFGRYLTSQQFTDTYGPTAADYEAVVKQFTSRGLTVSRRPNRLLLRVTGPSSGFKAALNTNLSRYASVDGEYFAADSDPQLPAALAGHVSALVGLRSNVRLKPNFKFNPQLSMQSSAATGPANGLSPQDIAKAYNIPAWLGGGFGESIALLELGGYDKSDIKKYAQKFGLPSVKLQDVFVDGFPGGSLDPFSSQVEVTLDIEMVQAIAPLASKIQVYQGYNDWTIYLDLLNRIVTDNTSKQVSTSFGNPEDVILMTPGGEDFLRAENYLLMQAAAQGQAVFAASGDRGAFDGFGGPVVDDPAAQPYAIGVGGTSLTTSSTGAWLSENTWNDFSAGFGATGGGVSQFWPITSVQAPVVTAASGGSLTNRNVPDVALNASPLKGYSVYEAAASSISPGGDGWLRVGGTSASAPLWAAFMAIVNSDRLLLGRNRLGWPAPALYSLAQSPAYSATFHDIADFGNNGLYQSVPGYDLTTGLGTINGFNLVLSLLDDPKPAVSPGPQPVVPVLTVQSGDQRDYLQWSAVPNATKYKVYRTVSGSGTPVLVKTLTATTWTDSGVTNDVVYDYTVASVGSWGTSAQAAIKQGFPTAIDWIFFPDYFPQTASAMTFFWATTAAGANSLDWGYSATNLNHHVTTQFGNGGGPTITGLTPGATIYFRVKVDGGNGVLDSGVQVATP